MIVRSGRRGAVAAALASLALAALSPTGAAALEAGTPLTPAPGVPAHGRAWELITSPDPVSALVARVSALAEDGNRIFYETYGALPDAPVGEPLSTTNRAFRGPDGWAVAAAIGPYPELFEGVIPNPKALDANLQGAMWENTVPSGGVGMFRTALDGQFTLLGTGLTYAGTSLAPQHLLAFSENHLVPADASRSSGSSLYEFVDATPRLVDVDDSGAPLSDCGGTVARGPNWVSHDGQRIFFATSPGCSGPARLFLRSGGTETTEISASRCDLADCGPAAEASFAAATPSGSSAFFLSAERLTDADSNDHADLYRYDVADAALTLVSSPPGGLDLVPTPESVRPGADGSRVYFSAAEVLGPGELGERKLYLADASGVQALPVDPEAFMQLSGDGRFLVFSSSAAVLAGDSDERVDVYRFDAADGSIVRISAGPGGRGEGPFDADISINQFSSSNDEHPYRMLSADGSRIFFSTAEQLLPEDSNEVTDVYEWDRGDLGLISAGVGKAPQTYFAGVDANGTTALFLTSETLLPRDRDGGEPDLYAARIGGGFAETEAPPAGCSGSCQPARGSLGRPLPGTAGSGGSGIRLRPFSPAARRQIAASGWITVLAEVPARGRLSARARARVGGRTLTVATASLAVAEPGPVRLRLHLSRRARGSLAAGRALRVALTLRLSGSVAHTRFALKASS